MKKGKSAKISVRYANAQKLMVQETTHNNYFYWLRSRVKQIRLTKSQRQRLAQNRLRLKLKKRTIKNLTHKDLDNITQIVCKHIGITNSPKTIGSVKKTPFDIFISLSPQAWETLQPKLKKERKFPDNVGLYGLAISVNYHGEPITIQLISTKFLTKDARAFAENIMSHETSHSITHTLTKKARTLPQQFLDSSKDEMIAYLYEPFVVGDRRKKLTLFVDATRKNYEQTGVDLKKEAFRLKLLLDLVVDSKLPKKTLAELLRSNSVDTSIKHLLELQN